MGAGFAVQSWTILLGTFFITSTIPSAEMSDLNSPRPVPPEWVYEPWIWDDNTSHDDFKGHCQKQVMDMVNGYLENRIPVGVVLVDSPWETNFNTFEFEPSAYPDPAGMICTLHQLDIRVIVWITNILNVKSDSRYYEDWFRGGSSPNLDYARHNNFLIDEGQSFPWWWGIGCFIDHDNRFACEWWREQMDITLNLGIDGWKTDAGTRKFPEYASNFHGIISKKEYSRRYYEEFFVHTQSITNGKGIIFAKPFDEVRSDSTYVPVEYVHAAWVGDQNHAWTDAERGLENALINMLLSAERGFIAVGSDIGGFSPYVYGEFKPIERELFIRWTQLGAFSPIMENGGYDEHRPWMYDDEVLQIYRKYAILHHQLVPYLYSEGYACHQRGGSIIRLLDDTQYQYLLGDALLVAPLFQPGGQRQIHFPESAEFWYDIWQPRIRYRGGEHLADFCCGLDSYPVFIRSGAVIPVTNDDYSSNFTVPDTSARLVFLCYPGKESRYEFFREGCETAVIDCADGEMGFRVALASVNEPYILRIWTDRNIKVFTLNGAFLTPAFSLEEFQMQSEVWYKDQDGYYWVKCCDASQMQVFYGYTITGLDRTRDEKLPMASPLTISCRPEWGPFDQVFCFRLCVPKTTQLQIRLMNVLGQTIYTFTEKEYSAGEHVIQWRACNATGSPVASGLFFVALYSADQLVCFDKFLKLQ